MFIQFSKEDLKWPSPFNVNPSWLEGEDFVNLVKEEWKIFYASKRESIGIRFSQNLKHVKNEVSSWAHHERAKDEQELVSLEHQFSKDFSKEVEEGLNESSKENLKVLE